MTSVTANGGTVPLAQTALLNSLAAGTAYFNIHTAAFPGGEIRSFLNVPEPGTISLAGLCGLVVLRRRRQG